MSNYNVEDLADNLSYLSNTKSLIRNAITNKGQNITNETTFREYAAKITNISGGDNVDSYLFKDMNEMNAYSLNAKAGDYGVVYDSKLIGISTTGVYSNLLPMPENITFDNEITTWTNGLSTVNSMVANKVTFNIGPSRITISHAKTKIGSYYTNYYYGSNDGIHYNIDTHGPNSINDICDLTLNISCNYTPLLSKIFLTGYDINYDNPRTYNSTMNLWLPVETQLNALVSNILTNKTAYTDYNITGTFLNQTINGLNNLEVQNFAEQIQPIITNIQPMEEYVNTASLFENYQNIQYVPEIKSYNLYRTFNNCSNLIYVNINSSPNLNCAIETFKHCRNLTAVSNFDTSNVTNMTRAFYNCVRLTSIPNLDTSNVTNMYYMFWNCANLTMVPNFNTSNCISIAGLFSNCHNLTAVSNFDTSNVINIINLFENCYKLTSIPNFDTSNVVDMHSMFWNCSNLITIPNFNTTKVIFMQFLFSNCQKLTSVPNFNTSNVTKTYDMFYGCSNLTAIPNFDTKNVTDMSSMFTRCSNLTTIPNFNTHNSTQMNYMFFNCYNLTSVPQFNTSKVTTMTNMFYNCNKLTNASIQNIINMCLNSNITNATYKNLSNANSYSPLYNTKFNSSYYSNRLSELTAAGWSY